MSRFSSRPYWPEASAASETNSYVTMNRLPRFALILAVLAGLATASAAAQPSVFQYPFTCNRSSLAADFAQRDQLPQTAVPAGAWYARNRDGVYLNGGWGPRPVSYPAVQVPANAGCDAATWRRERILTVAMRHLNVPGNPDALDYRHHHIPAWNPPADTFPSGDRGMPELSAASPWGPGRGLDCSNFASWVYNYGLGIRPTSSVRALAGSPGVPAQAIAKNGPFMPGDLVYLHPTNDSRRVSHVVIYINDAYVIDDRWDYVGPDGRPLRGVHVRPRVGWYRSAVLGGWRLIRP